jgi:alpha-tubulin suppressor-like RCC1 family protein
LNHKLFGLDANYDQHPLPLVPGLPVEDVAIGQNHICLSTTQGEAYCWGDNTYGQMGSPGSGLGTFVPTPVWKPFGQ